MSEHVVQPGETLWRIARRYRLGVDELAERNGIEDPTRVRAGTVLRVPPTSTEAAIRPAGAAGPVVAPQAALAPPAPRRDSAPYTPEETPAPPAPAARSAAAGAGESPEAGSASPPMRAAPARGSGSGVAPSGATSTAPMYPLRWPVEGSLRARFGARDGTAHDGIDIAVPSGTDVRAAAAGKVIFSGRHGGYGNLVILRHDRSLVTVYAHNSVNLVRKGETVSVGQVVARVGDRARGGPSRLHFEVREGVVPRNPLKYLPP